MKSILHIMIRSYLGIAIFFAVQHQVSSLSADVDHRKYAQRMKKDKKYMVKELQNIQKRSETTRDYIDNYDLIVTEPPVILKKPVLRHRHDHHRHRAGKGAKFNIKTYNPRILQGENILRKSNNISEKTKMTQKQEDKIVTTAKYFTKHRKEVEEETIAQIQKYKDAGTRNYPHAYRKEVRTLIQEENDATTMNDRIDYRGEVEEGTTTQIHENKDAASRNDFNEHLKEVEKEVRTTIQEEIKATTAKDLNEYTRDVEKEITTQTQENKDAASRNYFNEHLKEVEKEVRTTIQEENKATTANDLNDYTREVGKGTTTQIQEDKDTTTKNNFNENRRNVEVIKTTHIQEDKNATSADDFNKPRRGVEEEAKGTQNPIKTNQNVSLMVPFYRRVNYVSDQERRKPQKWVHCLDLVGPRLKGYKDIWPPKILKNRHNDIRRLAELLNTDVSKYTEEEIVSVLSQISKINIRIFQWHCSSITMIMNVIITGPAHNFKTLKKGVKYMFERWHLDTSMMRTFLEQTRIFRPPCIDITGSDFTKKAGGVLLFTKPDKPTKKPRGGDVSCQSREINTTNHNNDL